MKRIFILSMTLFALSASSALTACNPDDGTANPGTATPAPNPRPDPAPDPDPNPDPDPSAGSRFGLIHGQVRRQRRGTGFQGPAPDDGDHERPEPQRKILRPAAKSPDRGIRSRRYPRRRYHALRRKDAGTVLQVVPDFVQLHPDRKRGRSRRTRKRIGSRKRPDRIRTAPLNGGIKNRDRLLEVRD